MLGNLKHMDKKEKTQIGLWFITSITMIAVLLYFSSVL